MKKDREITCTVEFTEGAIDRITEAFIDLYYGIKNGIYRYDGSFPSDRIKNQVSPDVLAAGREKADPKNEPAKSV